MVERPSPTSTFLDALSVRDFSALESSLAPAAWARLLLPRRTDELASAASVRTRLEAWFGSASTFEVIARESNRVGRRERLTWRLRVVRDAGTEEVIEQVAFVDVGQHGIERIDLLCSGFLPSRGAE
jgi:hypothetical protein